MDAMITLCSYKDSKVDTLIIVHLSNTYLWRMFLNMLKDNR